MPDQSQIPVSRRTTDPLGPVGQVDISHLRGDDSVGHLGPPIIPSDDSVHVRHDAGAPLERAKLTVPAPSPVIPAGFHGDQCC
jgi:hypothetical protein